MKYLCVHGYLYSSCESCQAMDDAIEEYMMAPPEIDKEYDYMYDIYLDRDEQLLRESEEK